MTTTRSRRTLRSRRHGATTRWPQRWTATTSTQIHPLYPSLNLLLCADQSDSQPIHRSGHATSPPTTSRRGGSRGAELASPSPRLSRGAHALRPPTRRRRAVKRASRPLTRRRRARHASLRNPRPLDERASPPTRRLRLGSRARRRPNRRPRTRLQDEPGLVRVKRASLALHHRARPRLRAVPGSQRARTRRRAAASAGRASPRRRPSRRRQATTTRGRGASAERAARHPRREGGGRASASRRPTRPNCTRRGRPRWRRPRWTRERIAARATPTTPWPLALRAPRRRSRSATRATSLECSLLRARRRATRSRLWKNRRCL